MRLVPGRAAFVRIAPFAVFMALLGLRGMAAGLPAGGFDPRWLHAVSVLLAAALLWWWRGEYGELSRQTLPSAREAALAAGVGLAVFVLWIALDAPWMKLDTATAPFRPVDAAGRPDWPLVAARWLGATLLVPVMEELFWRSFLMRWLHAVPFTGVDPRRSGLRAVVLSTFVFALAHTLWLAAVVAGLAYAWLYRRTGRLWTAVIAHAVTNGALGAWVVATRDWSYW